MERIKVNHRGKEYIIPRVMLEKAMNIALHCCEVSSTSSMNPSFLSSVRN